MWQLRHISFLLPFLIILVTIFSVIRPSDTVSAATTDTLNFQGRLLTSSGSLVSDGSYNIEFKIYDSESLGTSSAGVCSLDSSTDDCWWIEAQTVTVRNGYFSVYLGEVTPFSSTVPWDQELWMTMNVNSDGEMNPRFKMTAVPYAFRAGSITDSSGNSYTGDDLVQVTPSTIQSINSALSIIRLNQAGSGGLIQLQGDGVDVFTLDKTGAATFGSGITLGNSGSTTAGTIRWTGTDFEGYDGSTWKTLTSSGIASSTDYYSLTTNANSNASAAEYDVFQSGSYGSYASTTNASEGFVYSPGSGRFTVANDGTYNINANLFLESSANALMSIIIRVNGVDVYNNDVFIHGAVDPVERSVNLIRDLNSGDYIEVFVDGTSGNITTHGGSSMNIVPVSTAGSGGGGGGVNPFEQNGNSFGSTAILGTSDANGLRIITNTATALEFTSTGDATFTQDVDFDSLLSANNGIDITTGDLDLSGGDIVGANVISATSIAAEGSGLTDLNGDEITSGTIGDARLSNNVSLLDTVGDFSATQTFTGGAVLGNFTSTSPGAIRWTGTDFEGYDGTDWVSFTGGGATLLDGVLAFGKVAGNGTPLNIDGATVARNAVGDYTVTLDTAATTADYTVLLTVEEPSATLDDTKITIDNQTTAGFDVDVREGDNGATADTRIDRVWHFTVLDADAVAGGGFGGGSSSAFEQNGNSFGTTAVIGTNDNNGLRIVTNGNPALEFTSAGDASFSQDVEVDGLLTANNGLDITSGNLDLSSGNIVGVTNISATTLSGDGAGITNLSGDEILTGTIDSARLDTNVALIDADQTFSGLPTFDSGLVVGNSASAETGKIRWNGSDFEGFNGISWVSFTNSPVPPSGGPASVGPFTFDADGDADEAAWTFVSDNGGNGLNASGTARAWSHETGDTPSNDVGPTSGQGGAPDGYIYTEASAPAAGGDTFTTTLNGTIDASAADWTVEFYWNQRGNDNVATVEVQTNEASAGWVTRGTYGTGGPDVVTGGSQQWNLESLDLTGVISDASTEVRFLVTLGSTGNVWNNDFALDTISIISSADPGGSSEPEFAQGGNAFGTGGVIGTTDANGLSIITNNTAAIVVASDGTTTFSQDAVFNSDIILGTSTITSAATGSQTITLPDASGTICLSGGNCGYLELASGSFINDATSNDSIAINKTNASGNIISLQRSGGAVFTVANTGSLQIQSTDNTALDVRNVGGTSFFSVDTSSGVTTIDTLNVTNGISGAGLANCTGEYDVLQWDSGSGLFSCRNGSPKVIQVFDSAGGTDINNATAAVVPFGGETVKTTGYTHSNVTNNSRITMDEAGWYRLGYNVSSLNSSNNRATIRCRARLNGTTFINTSASYSYSRNNTDDNATNTASMLFETTAPNEYIEILCDQAGTGGVATSIANETWLSIEKR